MKNLIEKFRPKKIKTQLILGITLVHLILMAVFVFDLMSRQEDFLRDQNHNQTLNLAKNMAVNVESYLIANDYYTLERITRSYTNFPYLRYAMILSPEGVVLAHTNERNVGSSVSDKHLLSMTDSSGEKILLDNRSILDVAVPVMHEQEFIGWVRLGVGQDYIYKNLNAIVRNGVYYILIALGVGSVLAILMGNLLNRGLYKLINAAEEIRKGNRGKRIGEMRSYELSNLGTALNEMVEEISSKEKKLNMILESMPVGVFTLDAQGNILTHNPAAEKIWEGVEYIGPAEYSVYKARFSGTGKTVEPEEWAAAVALKEKKDVLNQEVEIDCFDGSSKTILNSAIIMKDINENIEGVLVINVEITERKALERERENVVTDLLQRNRDLEQFSYIVSHNIRGPLATLLGLSNLLNADNSAAEKQMILRGMGEHAGKLDMVVQDLNEILSVKKNILQSKVEVKLEDIVSNVKSDLGELIKQSNASISTDFSKAANINTIKAYLHSIFINLISNSIKYKMPGAHPVIEIWSEKHKELVKIYFKDNGAGIDLDLYSDQIFGLYKRFNLNTEGKGMGLYMVKTQVTAMNGTIELESKPDKGSMFTVTLPLD